MTRRHFLLALAGLPLACHLPAAEPATDRQIVAELADAMRQLSRAHAELQQLKTEVHLLERLQRIKADCRRVTPPPTLPAKVDKLINRLRSIDQP